VLSAQVHSYQVPGIRVDRFPVYICCWRLSERKRSRVREKNASHAIYTRKTKTMIESTIRRPLGTHNAPVIIIVLFCVYTAGNIKCPIIILFSWRRKSGAKYLIIFYKLFRIVRRRRQLCTTSCRNTVNTRGYALRARRVQSHTILTLHTPHNKHSHTRHTNARAHIRKILESLVTVVGIRRPQ
jgi:hypothetical protein